MAKRPQQPYLTAYTGYLLRRAYVRSAECAHACMPEGAHIREVAILSILAERGAISQRFLGDITHVNRSLIVKLVDTLERKEWVVRERSTTDRRTYALRLTDKGIQALEDLQRDMDQGEAALTEGLTEDEVVRIKQWLLELLADDPSVAVTSLSGRTGYLITHAHRKLRAMAVGRLEPVGLDPRDFGVLNIVDREQPCSQSRLAASLGISPPAVLPMIDELESAGLVSRVRNADDRRVYNLTLTAEGAARLAKGRTVASDVQKDIAELLGPEADADLRQLLMKLIAF